MEECLVISPFVVSFAEYIATRVFLRFQYISDSQWDQRVKFEQPGTLHWLLKEPSIIGGWQENILQQQQQRSESKISSSNPNPNPTTHPYNHDLHNTGNTNREKKNPPCLKNIFKPTLDALYYIAKPQAK